MARTEERPRDDAAPAPITAARVAATQSARKAATAPRGATREDSLKLHAASVAAHVRQDMPWARRFLAALMAGDSITCRFMIILAESELS